MANLSILKNGKAKAIRFSTLELMCKALDFQPPTRRYFRIKKWYRDLRIEQAKSVAV